MRGSPKEKPLSCMGYGVVGQLDIQRDSHRRRAPGREEALRVRGVEGEPQWSVCRRRPSCVELAVPQPMPGLDI